MANKITKDTIKKLIEEVLKEEQLNEFTTIKWKKNKNYAADVDPLVGRSGTPPTFTDFKKIAAADGIGLNLSKTDITNAAKKSSLEPILRDLANNSKANIGAFINTTLGPAGAVDALAGTSVPDIEPGESALKVQDAGIAVKDRKFDQPLGRIDPGAAYDLDADFKATKKNAAKNQVGVNSTLYNVFRAVPGDDLGGKLSYLKGVADLIQNDESLKSVADDEIFKISNAMMVFNNLANLSKAYGASEAGFVMESMLAGLIMGFKPKGKGTSDMVTHLKSGKGLYSSKFTKGGGSNAWGDGTDDRMKSHIKAGDVYYINVKKVGATTGTTASTAYNSLEVYITKLKQNTKVSNYRSVSGEYLKPDGTFAKLSNVLQKPATNPKVTFSSTPFLSIPLLKKPDASYVKIGERVASYIEQDSKNPLFEAILEAAQRLQNMQKNTEEYRAARGSGQAGKLKSKTASAKDYVNAVATDYSKIKVNFTTIFKSDLGTEKRFNENKVISPIFLKKLISESFKK